MSNDAAGLSDEHRAYRAIIWGIAASILIFACGVVAVAQVQGNRQLLKDGLDWGYDVAIYGVAAVIFGRAAGAERVAALAVAAIWVFAGLHTLYDLWDKYVDPRPIEVGALGFSAASAILIAYLVVGVLFRFRKSGHPLIAATWLSSRNDCVSTTVYSLLILGARVLPQRWLEYALDVFSACLALQAAAAILLKVRASARAGDYPSAHVDRPQA